jgi:hypothetical protein
MSEQVTSDRFSEFIFFAWNHLQKYTSLESTIYNVYDTRIDKNENIHAQVMQVHFQNIQRKKYEKDEKDERKRGVAFYCTRL